MKTHLIDFILSTILLTAIAITALLVTGTFVSSITTRFFGDYHIISDALIFLLLYGLFSAATTRALLQAKPLEPGKHSMESSLFTWWKLFTVTYEFGRGALLPFTVVFLKPLVATLFGANIGKDIALGGHLVDPELITIGDEAIIGQGSVISAHTITSGCLILSPVVIGPRATVGVNAVLMSGVQIGADAVVTAGSVVPPDTKIPAGELWGGIPAMKIKSFEDDLATDL